MLSDHIEELARLYEAGTLGEWFAEGVGGIQMDGTRDGFVIGSSGERRIASLYPTTTSRQARQADAELIPALRNSFEVFLPVLRAAVEYVEALTEFNSVVRGPSRLRLAEDALVAAVEEAQK